MDDAWWGPSIPLHRRPVVRLSERSLPGLHAWSTTSGKRFVNEAAPYVEATHAMYGGTHGQGDGPGENIPAWLILDQRYRDRYTFAGRHARAPRSPAAGSRPASSSRRAPSPSWPGRSACPSTR